MARRFRAAVGALAGLLGVFSWTSVRSQDAADRYFDAIDHPAIAYRLTPATDSVSELARRIAAGTATLTFADTTGYLPALLRALDVPVASQLAVFSKTSLQKQIVSPQNPRAIYFNDSVVVAWPRGGFIEIAAHDPRLGVVFYMLSQQQVSQPQIVRRMECLTCHHSYTTRVPGLFIRSVVTGPRGEGMPFLGNYLTDDRSPLEERWGGWFVTGSSGGARHLGNQMPPVTRDTDTPINPATSTLAEVPDALRGYLSPRSDIVAHLVFDHQARVINLMTQAGWEVRLAEAEALDVAAVATRDARELADALLFVDEARLPPGIVGDSAFAAQFTARGPADGEGRSLRQFDLRSRLMRYPCSFMIYAAAFDALPPVARDAVYRRLWAILSGEEKDPRYARLTAVDRRAVVNILRDTKKGLPEYFRQPF